MAIILRFVDDNGILRERFFGVVGVENTTALILKEEICKVFTKYNLSIDNMRGQGYDGASNMRGAWNGLQALFRQECPYAYYVHCFAHRLQLALVETANDEQDILLLFSMVGNIVNLITSSPKRQSEFRSPQAYEVAFKIAIGELQTSIGGNQIGSLQRAGATHWSSHFGSISRLMITFDATCTVLENIARDATKRAQRGEAMGALKSIKSFEFVFMLHLMNAIMGITEVLCQALQQKSQDNVNAMSLVSTTKKLLHKLRENGWNDLLMNVDLFCQRHTIDRIDMSSRYTMGSGRPCQQWDDITFEHHYHFDIFNEAINFQLEELASRFTEGAMELLILSSALDPRDDYTAFKIDDIYSLVEKFYHQDFTEQEVIILSGQLQHYYLDIPLDPRFQNLSTISELCQKIVETKKSGSYSLINRLLRLILTLPVSTATTARAFSTIIFFKTSLRNKMEDRFLSDCLMIYIERELVEDFDLESIIDDFFKFKNRWVQENRI